MKVHNENASTRGKAIFRAPIIERDEPVAERADTMDEAIIIMIVPCSPTVAMYCAGPNMWLVGINSSVRIPMARMPPVKKKSSTTTVYCRPDDLVVERRAEVPRPAV